MSTVPFSQKQINHYAFLHGLVGPPALTGYQASTTNIYNALTDRVLFKQHFHSRVFERCLSAIVQQWIINFPMLPSAPITLKRMVDARDPLVPRQKLKLYIQAAEQLAGTRPRRYNTYHMGYHSGLDGEVTAFVKYQKEIEDEDLTLEEPKTPRAINARNICGVLTEKRFITKSEDTFYRFTHHCIFRETWCSKGMNPQQKAAAILKAATKYKNPIFVEADFSRFDSSVNRYLIKHFQDFIKAMNTGDITEYEQFCKDQINNRITTQQGVKAHSVGRVMSGDGSTAYKNIFICALVHRLAWSAYSLDDVATYFQEGDDTLYIVEAAHLDKIVQIPTFFSFMGLKLKLEEPKTDVRTVTFCKMRMGRYLPKIVGQEFSEWKFCRNPESVLTSAFSTPNYGDSDKSIRFYLQTVGAGLEICESGVPVTSVYGAKVRRDAGMGVLVRPDYRTLQRNEAMYWRLKNYGNLSYGHQTTDQARIDFEASWGVTVALQHYIEERIQLCPALEIDHRRHRLSSQTAA